VHPRLFTFIRVDLPRFAGKIPPNSTLVFDVLVVRIGSRKQVVEQQEDDEWLAKGGGKEFDAPAIPYDGSNRVMRRKANEVASNCCPLPITDYGLGSR
jgi:hypothetical protein